MQFFKWIYTKFIYKVMEIFIYPVIHLKINNYHIMNIIDTINKLIDSNKSLSRFGDGEIRCVCSVYDKNIKSCGFQNNNNKLAKALINVLKSHNNNLMIGLPDAFLGCNNFVYHSNMFWRGTVVKYWKIFSKYLNDKQYYNANISRFYIDYKHKSTRKKMFNLLRKIWTNKDILIVEGNKSNLGVNDSLFNNSKSVHRIECPNKNAFNAYNKILKITLTVLSGSNYLTLIALGPTATVLASDLSNHGYRAIDIGQVDLEYEWALKGAKKRFNIPYKYVNEVNNGDEVHIKHNKKFRSEVIARIK